MLEVKDLRKVYKTKNGADVNALDGVSLSFKETGMVFLLGKSGSGKSTLLNVCGGLDSPTNGEIIVKGRSSKDFTQSDFDSYRNTFIGFIFQEYNILNEFSVEDNIALALELQGKPKDKEAIAQLLSQVDLEGFAKRKPNTLSGGQKQRIAIARALIKSPEIIMADEPTGALDSNTGKQVFETLKKLSRDKLVIVVSHDRDFAEQYGDRIIELKDGKVISDVTKTEKETVAVSENVSVVGDVLCVKKGAELNDTDFQKIKTYLKGSNGNVIIANNEQDVEKFKKVSRINENGVKEVFCDTTDDGEKCEYTKEDSRFIRSKLPLRHAAKIGVSGLRNKPVRLFFTVILCTVAFVLFGLLSTLNFYDSEATFKQTMADSSVSAMKLEKQYKAKSTWYSRGEKEYEYDDYFMTKFTNEELKKLKEDLGEDAFGAVRASVSFNVRQASSRYYKNNINAFAYISQNNALRQGINGAYPQKDDEIAITSYIAEVLYKCNAFDNNGVALELAQPSDIIGKSVNLGGRVYKITGIINTEAIPEQYAVLNDAEIEDTMLQFKYESYLSDGLHLVAFVTENRLAVLSKESTDYTEGLHNYTRVVASIKSGSKYEFPEWSNARYATSSVIVDTNNIVKISGESLMPAGNDILVPSALFASSVGEAYRKIGESFGEDYETADKYYQLSNLAGEIEAGGKYQQNATTKKDEFIAYTAEELKAKIASLAAAAKRDKIPLKLGIKIFDDMNQTVIGDVKEYNISGVILLPREDEMANCFVMSDDAFTKLWDEQKMVVENYAIITTKYISANPNAVYNTVYVPYQYSEDTINTYWALYNNDEWKEDDSRILLTGNFIGTLQSIDGTVEGMSKIFLYVGIVLALFAALLFSNFISVSISQKTRDIGILRAVGARSADVFKIFFSESFVIAAICLLLSTVACAVLCGYLNTVLAEGIGASLLVFGIASFVVMLIIAFVTAVAATFIPVNNAAKKKPVDSIRSL